MNYKFLNDYSEGCHPLILKRLAESNLVQQAGYGGDIYTTSAAEKIKNIAENQDLEVYFVAGGTLANLLVISSFLKPYESVISAESGHINTHEAGAVEATGHKIEYVKTLDGKLTTSEIAELLYKFPKYHTVKPRMVYISNPTELGTIYKKDELLEIYRFCQENNLLLFIDGARLPMALTAEENDLSLAQISRLCDVFYIGGTKCGGLFGEAVVVANKALQEDFPFNIKQRGAMMAKSRSLGIQFETLFSENLIFDLAKYANTQAAKLADVFKEMGGDFLTSPQTNQIFPILKNSTIMLLKERYDFFEWQKINKDHTAIRLVCSWATPEEEIQKFISFLLKAK